MRTNIFKQKEKILKTETKLGNETGKKNHR